MKKIFYVLFILLSVFLVACNENVDDNKNVFKVTFDVDSGLIVQQVEVEEGKTINIDLFTTSKDGFEFKGWSLSKGGSVVTGTQSITKDTTFYVIFEKNVDIYDITFKNENEEVITTKQVEEGKSLNLAEISASKENYEFTGWSLTKGGSIITGNYNPTNNTTFYAVFKKIIVKYDISFKNENGDLITTIQVEENIVPTQDYAVTDTQEWDYSFDGWSLTQNGEVLTSLPKAVENVTYFAIVSKVKKQYKVSFNVNQGTTLNDITYDYGTVVNTLPNTVKEGFKFVGWTTDVELTTEVQLPLTITGDITLYAVWNEKVDLTSYLEALLEGYKLNPYSYIPDQMKPEAKIVDQTNVNIDYADFVATSNITVGYGEQWQMVLDNLNQSQTFFNLLSAIEGISSASVVAFNNYLDSNPANENTFEFEQGIYKVNIEFKDGILTYILSYETDVPMLGTQVIQIAITYNTETLEKEGRIQIGDANALRYEISDNSYKFGIKYLGVRRAYFEIDRDSEGNVEGAIFEYLTATIADKDVTYASASQFLITDSYVSVVGNKADGIIGFSNYINELYSTTTGELLGYEVKETKTILSTDVTFNTLWFNLSDQTGITSVKLLDDGETKAFYINNDSTNAFETKTVGGFSTKTASRRYDIEFRTQYVYYKDVNDKLVQAKIEVPMLFVQEEQLNSLPNDIKEKNKQITEFVLTASQSNIDKIKADYSVMIDIFIENKDNMNADLIVDYIGTKYVIE